MRIVALTATAFLALGPPIGVVFFFLPTFFSEILGQGPSAGPHQGPGLVVFLVMVAYPSAGPAAVATGAIIGLIAWRYRWENQIGLPTRAFVGALVGGTVGASWQLISLDLSDPTMFLKLGALSGGALALAFPRASWGARAL